MHLPTTLCSLLLCMHVYAAEFTTESLGKELVEMQKASSEINPQAAKAFLERFVNPVDLKKAKDDGKNLDDLSAQFSASGKFAALADILKRVKASDGEVNVTDSEIACKIASETSEGWIRFVFADNRWYIKN